MNKGVKYVIPKSLVLPVFEVIEEKRHCYVTHRVDDDDPRYGEDIHLVPAIEDGDYYSFGVHEFNRKCYCHPQIQEQVWGRTLVIHSEQVN